MFTGLVETCGKVSGIEARSPGKRLTIAAPNFFESLDVGASVAISGCCLTIVRVAPSEAVFEFGEETQRRTTLDRFTPGLQVNLEKALTAGAAMGGHILTGHVDGVGVLMERRDNGGWSDFRFRVPPETTRQIASKGSIGVDGVSLTVVDVDRESFGVALIPHTLAHTTLGTMTVGSAANIETDILAKYVERQLREAGIVPGPSWGLGASHV